jgi:branched-chain amino acid transport system ATP-binding protein
MPDIALRIYGISVKRDSLPILLNINLELDAGGTVAILGANGAGKTTLLNTLSGFLKPHAGTISLFGRRIDGEAPHTIVQQGLVHVSQERDLFTHLTVLDNLLLGAFTRPSEEIDRDLARVFDYFPKLADRRRQVAGTIPLRGGEHADKAQKDACDRCCLLY